MNKVFAFALLIIVAACSETNPNASFGPSGHPDGWLALHGASAKGSPETAGFVSCQGCHGEDFKGGISALSCLTASGCHGAASPHPAMPWPGHMGTDADNAAVCALCHINGANSSVRPSSAPEAGAGPGCFNSTLCHGAALHPDGWTTGHVTDARSSVSSCGTASCHGADFLGGATGISCYRCHLGGQASGAGITHPSRWADPQTSHKSYVKDLDGDARSCSPTSPRGVNVAHYCHGEGLLDGATRIAPPNGSWAAGPSCYECHGKKWSAP